MGWLDNQQSNWSNYYSHEQVTKRREEETKKRKREEAEKQQRRDNQKKKLLKKKQQDEWLQEDLQKEQKALQEMGVSTAVGEEESSWAADSNNGSTPNRENQSKAPVLQRGFGPGGNSIPLQARTTKAPAAGPNFGPQGYQKHQETPGQPAKEPSSPKEAPAERSFGPKIKRARPV